MSTEPCSDALSPVRQSGAAGDGSGEHAGGGQAGGTRPSSAQLRGQWGQALGEQEVASLPGDAAAARGTQGHLCSRASFEAPLEGVQARACGPLASPSLSSLTGKVEKTLYLPSYHRHSGLHIPVFSASQGWVERALEKGWMWFRFLLMS